MANELTANGISINNLQTTIANLENVYKNVYGQDLIVDSNTPTGQIINIQAQIIYELLTLNKDIFNSFDPDSAYGRQLDRLCALNLVYRIGASFSTVYVDITTDRTVTLQGLDTNINSLNATGFTVADNNGNQYYLANTTTLNAGTTSLLFRAAKTGNIQPEPATITNFVTIVLGVLSCTNLDNANTIGQTEESDYFLKVRRKTLIAKNGTGYIDNLIAKLLDTENNPGVISAIVWDNDQNTIDTIHNIPAKTMWVIVEGGSDVNIANIIYQHSKFGQDTKGSVVVNKTSVAGQVFTIKFDRPATQDLYIKFDIKITKVGTVFNAVAIKNYIADNLSFALNEDADTTTIGSICLDAITNTGGGGKAINVQISTNNTNWFDYITSPSLQNKFTINVNKISYTAML